MKRCPQCNNVFPDNLIYCTHDGTPLVAENLSMPSDFAPTDAEEETVIRREPITIDFSGQNAPTEQINYAPTPPVAPIVVERQRNTGKYLLFLIVGLIFGGVLVLGTLLLAKNYYQGNTTAKTTNTNPLNAKTPSANSAANKETKTPTATPTATPTIEPLNSEHQTKTDESDEEFNGRVISANAYVRSEPSKSASQIDILPVNDRLHIERRENESSPWFYVTCEHGTSGWMHGNTIEYAE